MVRRSGQFVGLGLALFLFNSGTAFADLGGVLPELGDLQHWSLFTLGSHAARDEFVGNAVIQGDVGVAGAGDIVLRDNAIIQGDLYYRSNGTLTTGPGISITGAQIHDQDILLDNDVTAAIATSRHAASLRQTFFAPTNLELGGNRNFTVAGAPGRNVVLKLGNFTLSGNSTFTLQGTASTTFIINVTKQFALSGNAKIVLAGDVQWSNVLFNIRGRNSAVTLSGDSSFSGMLMANRRTVELSGRANVTGEVIANRLVFSNAGFKGNAGSVSHPPIVSP